MNWLITGGCGFIGKNLVAALRQDDENHRIRILDNLSTGTRDDLSSASPFCEVTPDNIGFKEQKTELVVGEVTDSDLAVKILDGIDVVVHLAANTGVGPSIDDPAADFSANVVGTFNYLEAARHHKVSRFVMASSNAMIGDVTPPMHEELPAHPVSPYGASKLAGEGYCSAYYSSFGLETVALRFANVYGPGSTHKSSVVAKFIRQALAGETLEIYGDGNQTRDFIYIHDLIAAVIFASTRPSIGGEVFQIATNRETSLTEMSACLIDVLESNGVSGVKVVNGSRRVGDIVRNYSDTTKSKSKLGWEARVDLKSGMEETIRYFLDNKE